MHAKFDHQTLNSDEIKSSMIITLCSTEGVGHLGPYNLV